MNNKILYVWLSKLNFSNYIKLNLINKFDGLKNMWDASYDDCIDLEIDNKIIEKILDRIIKEQAVKDYEFMKKNNIDIIFYEDLEYPNKLRVINDFPLVLHIIGNKKILNMSAVRNCWF